ncbi:hypothetical protein [Aeromicrobium sp.]|uniref:hypothetical protein n=1 Tax=Aeromicrobium sp. TaxID=1871063 RepID=UPI003D6B3C06
MTASHPFHFTHYESAQIRHMLVPTAIGVTLATIGFTALGIYGDGSPGAEASTSEFLIISGIAVVAAAIVFAVVIPRTLDKDAAAMTALTLSILGAITVMAFWAGVTLALAFGGILLGMAARESAKGRTMAIAAMVLGLVAVVAYVGIYLWDWMSTNGMI